MARRFDSDTVLELLETYYATLGSGETPDLDQMSGGDVELLAELRALIEAESRLTDGLSAGPSSVPEIPDFEIQSFLGAGGMAEVYAARQKSLDRDVALKIFSSGRFAGADEKRRFLREAAFAASVEDPHIVPIYAAGEHDGTLWIAMRRLSGPALDQVPLPLPWLEVARIGREAAAALAAVHDNGILHRDLKPANLILDHGNVVLVDFGLAAGLHDNSLTREGTVPGTLLYLAPEVLRFGRVRRNHLADIYALGATLHHLVSGVPPFDAENPERCLQQILSGQSVRMQLTRDARDLETLICASMSLVPEDRPPSARELEEEFQRVVEGRPIHLRRRSLSEDLLRRAARHPRIVVVAVMTVLLLSFGANFLLSERREARLNVSRDLETTRRLLESGDLTSAEPLIRSLKLRAIKQSEVDVLHREYLARTALEDLWDMLQERPDNLNPGDLRVHLESVKESGGLEILPFRAPAALVLAAFLLNDLQTADAICDTAQTQGFTSAALEVYRNFRGLGSFDVPVSQAFGDVDAILTAAILERHIDTPLAERRRRLENLEGVALESFRVRYALAILEADSGNFPVAEAWLKPLATREPVHYGAILLLAWLRLRQDDETGTEFWLQKVPPACDHALMDEVRLEILWNRRDPEGWRKLVEVLQRRPDDPQVLELAARFAEARGERDAARSYLQQAMSKVRSRRDQKRLLCQSHLLEFVSLFGPNPDDPLPAAKESDARVKEMTRELEGVVVDSTDAELRALALWLLSWADRAEGRRASALTRLAEAADLSRLNHEIRGDFVLECLRALGASQGDQPTRYEEFDRALDIASSYARNISDALRRMAPERLADVLYAGAVLAHTRGRMLDKGRLIDGLRHMVKTDNTGDEHLSVAGYVESHLNRLETLRE